MRKELLFTFGLISVCNSGYANPSDMNAEDHGDKKSDKLNVLMIMVDDLRPELTCFGRYGVISPNIDSLASSGVLFSNAYCNAPVSGASRASLLTGLRPAHERFVSFQSYAQNDAPWATSLPAYFKSMGYTTYSLSKVFHHQDDFSESWDVNWRPDDGSGSWRNYVEEDNIIMEKTGRSMSMEFADVEDEAYYDGQTAEKAVSVLKSIKKEDGPFFMGLGFLKPHLPFNAPRKYLDMYDTVAVSVPDNYELLNESIPEEAFHTWGELRYYKDIPDVGEGNISPDYAVSLIKAYRACVTYTDAQIGKVLKALDDTGLRENTVVLLLGDHGWSLGEHGQWCKHSTFDIVMNAPLIISAPGLPEGKIIDEVVEFVDIYPTLAEASGLPVPSTLDGESLVPLMNGRTEGWKNVAVVKWGMSMASVRQDFGYTVWRDQDGEIVNEMLFDHTTDKSENFNIAADNRLKKIISQMRGIISTYKTKW